MYGVKGLASGCVWCKGTGVRLCGVKGLASGCVWCKGTGVRLCGVKGLASGCCAHRDEHSGCISVGDLLTG